MSEQRLFSADFGPFYGPLYLATCMIGFIGNSLIVLAFTKKWVPLTPFTMLLLNLSVANIFSEIVWLPTLFIHMPDYIEADKNLSSAVCGIVASRLPATSGFFVNVLTVTYMSFIRTSTFSDQKQSILEKKNVVCFIACVWFVSMIVFFPWYFMFTMNTETRHCESIYQKPFKIYQATICAFFYVVPLSILVVNFVRSVRYMWKKTLFEQSILRRERRQITTLLLSLTLIYITFFIPIVLFFIVRASGRLNEDMDIYVDVRRPVGWICFLTTITDPVIYAFCRKGFRNGFTNSRKETRRTQRAGTAISLSSLTSTSTNNLV